MSCTRFALLEERSGISSRCFHTSDSLWPSCCITLSAVGKDLVFVNPWLGHALRHPDAWVHRRSQRSAAFLTFAYDIYAARGALAII